MNSEASVSYENLEESKETQPQRAAPWAWVTVALLSGLSYGLTVLCLGKTSFHGFETTVLFSTGPIAFCFCQLIYTLITNKKKSGKFWVWEESAFNREDKVNWYTVMFVMLSAG